MQCCSACFTKTLQYTSPAHGGWGVIRIAALVPEMKMLFAAPFACGRHGALGAILNGIKDKVAYLFIDEKDIVSGSYEEKIVRAIDEYFVFLGSHPKAFFYFTSCLDDLLGTDHPAILAKLNKKYPDVMFRDCHMDPIQMDTAAPPQVSLLTNIYSLLERNESERTHKKNQINFLGNNIPVSSDCEFFSLLKDYGISVRQLGLCKTFAEFQEMSESCLDVVLSPTAKTAAKNLEKNPGIASLTFYNTYDVNEISQFYKTLSNKLSEATGRTIDFDIRAYREKAEAALDETAHIIKGTPVAIDFQAVRKPFTLAKVLLEHGFAVSLVAADSVAAFEQESFDWLKEHYPTLEIASPIHHDSPKFPYRNLSDSLCIGFDCGYMTGSTKVVDIMEDEGMYGFDGVVKLMKRIQDAHRTKANVSEMITEANLII